MQYVFGDNAAQLDLPSVQKGETRLRCAVGTAVRWVAVLSGAVILLLMGCVWTCRRPMMRLPTTQ